MMLLIAIVVLYFVSITSSDGTWSYSGEDGPSNWKNEFPMCGGRRQSPVNIMKSVYNMSIKDLTFTSYAGNVFNVTNNGHSIQFSMPEGNAEISGGALPNHYKFVAFHFHWGSVKGRGSEHRIKSKKYAAEIHFVHYDATRFSTFDEALKDPTGLGVVGVLVEEGEQNDEFLKFHKNILEVKNTGLSSTYEGDIQLTKLLPKSKLFYTYLGSLTTPPCNENVIWTVFTEPITLSRDQFRDLRKLMGEHGPISNNFRPIQRRNGRVIYSNDDMSNTK